jgi:hypothetical protein
MRSPLLTAVGTGLLAGLIAGLLDGLGRPPMAMLAGAGLIALLGLVLAILTLLVLPRQWAAGIQAGLLPDAQVELYARCSLLSILWVGSLIGPLLLLGLQFGFPLVLERIRSPLFGSAAVALIALVGVALGLGLAIVLSAALARAGERIIRRRPELTRWLQPRHNALAAGCVLLGILALGGAWQAFPIFFVAGLLLFGGVVIRRIQALHVAVVGAITMAALLLGSGQLAQAGPIARMGARLFGLS